MWGEKNQKRYVLSARLKASTVGELRIDRGRLFQSSEPKWLNDPSPTVLWVLNPKYFYTMCWGNLKAYSLMLNRRCFQNFFKI